MQWSAKARARARRHGLPARARRPALGMNFDFSARANHIMKLRLRALFYNIKIGVAAVLSIACVGLKF